MGATTAKVYNESMGTELKSLREGQKKSGPEVVSSTGITRGRLQAIEKGAELRFDEIVKLAEAYEYTPYGLVKRLWANR